MSESENPEDKGKRILKVEVKTDQALKEAIEENALLKAKIAEQEEVQSAIALETFERVKSEAALAHSAYASSIRVCTTPEALEGTLARIQDEEKSEKERNYRAPSGKSTMYNPNFQGDQYESRIVLVDKLYDAAYYNCQKYTKQEQEDARNKIDTLFQSLANSKSMEELKRRPNALGEMMKKHVLGECPRCHSTLVDSDVCSNPNCKYDMTDPKQTKDGYVSTGPEWSEAKERERMKRKGQ